MSSRIVSRFAIVVALVSGVVLGFAFASCGDDDGGGGLCPTGQQVCAGTCRDVRTDSAHCGGCGNACAGSLLCVDGACGCRAGLFRCGEQCVDLEGDVANCGTCGNACQGPAACPGDAVCASGVCREACPAGGCRCGGICTDMQIDARHCGMCGNRCPGMQVCGDGVCIDRGSDVDAGPPADDAGPPADDAGPPPAEDAGMGGMA